MVKIITLKVSGNFCKVSRSWHRVCIYYSCNLWYVCWNQVCRFILESEAANYTQTRHL